MKNIHSMIALIMLPLILMNCFGGVVSGIWLLCLGEWRILGLGLLVVLIGTFPISLALLPTALFYMPAFALFERGKIFAGMLVSIPASIYTVVVMTVWCCIVFYAAVALGVNRNLTPILIWSYGVATGPWSFMASIEDQGREDGVSTMYAFFISLAYMGMIVLKIIGNASFATCIVSLIVTMALALIVQVVLAVASFPSGMEKGDGEAD